MGTVSSTSSLLSFSFTSGILKRGLLTFIVVNISVFFSNDFGRNLSKITHENFARMCVTNINKDVIRCKWNMSHIDGEGQTFVANL